MLRLPLRTIDDAPESTQRASLVVSEKSTGYLASHRIKRVL
jgi:hypothetical protein